jgi:hypothetical protein
MNPDSVTLFQLNTEFVKVSIEAYFEGDNLTIDGYDIGKRVEEYWGRDDYEYKLTIPPETVQWMMNHFNTQTKSELLQALATQYNNNQCYSAIRDLLDSNKQPCSGFSW